MAIIYILVLGIGDFILYSVLNRKEIVSKWIAIGYAVFFACFVALHLPVFHVPYFIPFKQFISQWKFIFMILAIHFGAGFAKSRTDNNAALSDEVKETIRQKREFVLTKGIYFVLFFLQIIFILHNLHLIGNS